ncbi:DUF4347 domain-containing protein [Pseudomonas putida]|uniref:DUF4347 domain-containing protein n=1 Tax=Pseudomonas putida TaxID=303 RepID=UPI002364928F|nr:DUF4347 domain-containing protein [Pseudomonas putida]MDD2052326.1 DUF4347 domain-containing protein [Pseudomonas putida]
MKFLDLFKRQASPFTAARAPLAAALEPRMLFDGAIAATVAETAASAEHASTADAARPSDDASQHASDAVPPAATSDQRQEVVFIDGKVDNKQQLITGLKPGTEVVVLDSSKDGLQQIADYLKNRSDVDAIHLLSHGSDGTVELGNTWLNAQNIGQHSAALNAIGAALAADGDILVYGCSTAEGTQGTALLNELARLTQADVAGSVDPTGAADKGGDWQLERQTGQIEAASLNLVDYRSLLATPADQNFDIQVPRYLDSAGETIDGITYSMLQPTDANGGAMTITEAPAFISITGSSDRAIMFNFDGVITIPGPVDARMASADGSTFRLVSMEIDTGTSLNTSSHLIIRGYRDGVAVASDTLDTAASDSTGSVTYTKNGIANGFGGTLTFSSAWQNIDEIRITGTDTVIVVDDLKFAAAVVSSPAPVLTTSGGSAGFVEGNNVASTPVAIDPGLTLSDPDSPTLASAKVVISGNFQAGEDSLGFSPNAATMGDITGNYNASTGTLTLTSSGGASAAQWQAALRSVTYTNSSESPNTSNRTISFSANDGTNESNAGTRIVTVTAVNDTPIATTSSDTTAYTEGSSAIAIDSGLVLNDLDSSTLTSATVKISSGLQSAEDLLWITLGPNTGNIIASYNTGTGEMLLSSAGATATLAQWQAALRAVTYSNNSNSPNTGDRTITFTVNDGTSESAATTKTVSVSAVNDAPTVTYPMANQTATQNATFSFQFAGNTFNDPDGDTLTYTAQLAGGGALPAWLSFNATTRTFSGTPDNGDVGPLTIVVTASDGHGGTVTDDFTLTVANLNDAPTVAHPIADQQVRQGSALNFQFASNTFNDIDVGDSLSYTAELAGGGALPAWLSFDPLTRTFSGTPGAGEVGVLSVKVTASDGNGGNVADTFTLTVTSANPVVSDVSAFGTNGNGPYKAGDTITVVVAFDQHIYVSGGTPTLLLETGSIDRVATYAGGSGTNTLFFTYTVQAGDRSADLDYHSSTALALNGATIANSQSDNAVIALPTPGSAGSMGANASMVIDGIAPTINWGSVPADGTYVAGDALDYTLNFSEAVTVDNSGNTPYLEINIGGQIRHAEYLSGSATSTLVFRYIVQSGDNDGDGIVLSNNVHFAGSGIHDAAGNPLDPTFTAGATPGVQVDAVAPEVTGISFDGPAAPGTLVFTVTFSENVSGVSGSDFNLLTTGSASGALSSVTQISPNTYRVTVDTVDGQGTLGLTLNAANSGIVDSHGNALAVSFSTPGYAVNTPPPTAPSTLPTAPSGDPQLMAYPPVEAPPPATDVLWPSVPGLATSDATSPLLPAPLFEQPTLGSGIPSLGTIFISNGALAPSFIAQVFASSDSGGIDSGSGFLGFGSGDGGIFGSSSLAGIFSSATPESASPPVFGNLSGNDVGQGLRGVFGAPSLGQQLHELQHNDPQRLRELALALGQITEPATHA